MEKTKVKLIYILAQSHSGSTLVDSILGTHPEISSSGELRYLNWQLERTKGTGGTVEAETCCSCESDFRNCDFWSEVLARITQRTGNDIINDPLSFDTSHFGHYSYQNSGGHSRSFGDRLLGFLARKWLERGLPLEVICRLTPRAKLRIRNNWLLYELMAEVSGRNIVVDSSKHLLIALLLQASRPEDVWFVFLHRDVRGLAYSHKKRATERGQQYSLRRTVLNAKVFEERIHRYKTYIPNLQYFDCTYEEVVRAPSSFLDRVAGAIGASADHVRQADDHFYIDPQNQHLVAGNPMRYRGRQKVRFDSGWTKGLTSEELDEIMRRYC